MDGTALPPLPPLKLHVKKDAIDVDAVFSEWLSKLQKHFTERDFGQIANLFIDDCWWRDILALDWDFTTKQGHAAIQEYLASSETDVSGLATASGGLKPFLLDIAGQIWIQSAFTFESRHGDGRGFVRLTNVNESEWKAWTVFTQLEQLDVLKDREAQRIRSHAASSRIPRAETNGSSGSPPVLIVGAGQAGVSLGARLRHMGIDALLVDRHARVGDSWRSRYASVNLNTPTFTDHYPYLRYPDSWPRWLSRDAVADFMEHYAQLMGLHVQTKTTVTNIKRDEHRGFQVQLQGPDGTTSTVYPRHVVLATGVFSDDPVLPDFPGQDRFKGKIYHSGQHRSAADTPNVGDKKIAVIGPGTSGHDIAQDFVTCGAKSVSLIQRHAIFSLSAETWETMQLGLWNMDSITTEEADLVGNSIPLALARTMSIGLTKVMAEMDKDMLQGLRKAGLAVRTGDDGYGLADHQLIKGGHYYIDQGANAMIIDGRIRVHSCQGGVREFTEDGVTLDDGTRVDADVVVLATGFKHNVETARRLLGQGALADDLVEGFGDLDGEQERAGWWRPTGVRGFWYMTGSFMWCRQYSQTLALQIAADLKGLR